MKIIERLKKLLADWVSGGKEDQALVVAAINALPALLEVAEEASVLADCVDRWEESVAAVIGRSPETGMVTKPIRDALAKLHEANPQ